MKKHNLHTQKYTEHASIYQLFLPLNLEELIPEDDSVRLVSQICEELDYQKLLQAYSSKGRNPKTHPIILFRILLYAYSQQIFSCRKIEQSCRRDINFRWLLQDEPVPDHSTINRFCTKYLTPTIAADLFYQFVEKLAEWQELSCETIYLDGTKIEANANRYTFVWKKSITKFEVKMFEKWQLILEKVNTLYCQNFMTSPETFLADLTVVTTFLKERQQEEKIIFVHGKGRRKTELQRLIEKTSQMIQRKQNYDGSKQILGEKRNSYSKTDPDATFMRMKEDHMRNGQLKPAYNVQLAVDSEYIVSVKAFQDRNDTETLIPMLKEVENNFSYTYQNIVADAGYESEENYSYLEETNQTSYIKPKIHDQMNKSRFKKQLFRKENMPYILEEDCYICPNQKKLKPIGFRNKKTKTGFETTLTIYECEDCTDCPLKAACTKAQGNRKLYVSKRFLAQREASEVNITTKKGIKFRINRSIQVEGSFGVIKNGYQFTRFSTRGFSKITTELFLVAFGYNLNKLHHKLQDNRLRSYYHGVKVA